MAEFIDITEPRSPLGTENILRPYKRGEAEITVDVCTGVLRGTNFARSIRDMLGCVEKIPQEKMPEFREIILSVFCGREQPDDILELGAKIAAAAGYASELTALPKDIEVPAGESGGRMCLMSAPVKRRRLDLTVSEGDYHLTMSISALMTGYAFIPDRTAMARGGKRLLSTGVKIFLKKRILAEYAISCWTIAGWKACRVISSAGTARFVSAVLHRLTGCRQTGISGG